MLGIGVPFCFPEVASPEKPLGKKFIDMIQKHLPLMRTPEYNMERAENHLEKWIQGCLPVEPFGDVSALLPINLCFDFLFGNPTTSIILLK